MSWIHNGRRKVDDDWIRKRSIGVVIHSTLKRVAHIIANCVKKANQMLELKIKKVNSNNIGNKRNHMWLNWGMHNFEWTRNDNPDLLFTSSRYTNIRCHTMKLEKKNVYLGIMKYFFTQRVIDYWNSLPQSAVDAENINQFKDQLNIHL